MVSYGLRMLVLCAMASIKPYPFKKILSNVIGNKLHLIVVLLCISLISSKKIMCVYGLFESLLELLVPHIPFFPI